MLWEEYYDKFGYWATSTLISKMSKLESFGPADEVAEVIVDIGFYDEKAATRLLKKATAAGVKFSGGQLADFISCCDEAAVGSAIQLSADQFTTKDLDDLYTYCDDELLVDAAIKYQIKLPQCLADYQIEEYGYMSVDELVAEFNYILECLSIARERLEEAHTSSLWDIFRQRRVWSYLKHSDVEIAQEYITDAINTWNRLEFPEKDKSSFPKVFPCFSTSDMLTDFLISSYWMEVVSERRIKKLIRTVEQAISVIQVLRSTIQ